MRVNKFSSKDEASAAAGERLHQLLMGNKDKPVLLLLSGGSALSMLDFVSKQGTGEHLTIAMIDERFSTDPVRSHPDLYRGADVQAHQTSNGVNNFTQFQKTDFFTFALEMETNFFGSVPRAGETKEMLETRLEKNIRNWKEQNPNGLIFATLGMGADGHTAGIFPMSDETEFNKLFNSDSWVKAYTTDKHEYKERVTSTITLLKLIDNSIVFVCGQDKKEKFELAISNTGSPNTLPALVWETMKNVEVFTDIE